MVGAGGDYIRINGISFTVDDPSAYYEEAREAAMADARAKAGPLFFGYRPVCTLLKWGARMAPVWTIWLRHSPWLAWPWGR